MEPFGIVVIVVSVMAAAASVFFSRRASRLYDEIGRLGALWLDRSEANRDVAGEPVAEDLAQMLTAIAEHHAAKQGRTG